MSARADIDELERERAHTVMCDESKQQKNESKRKELDHHTWNFLSFFYCFCWRKKFFDEKLNCGIYRDVQEMLTISSSFNRRFLVQGSKLNLRDSNFLNWLKLEFIKIPEIFFLRIKKLEIDFQFTVSTRFLTENFCLRLKIESKGIKIF